MPSMTGTGVRQDLSRKQIFLAYGSETSSEFYLLDLSDGLASGANSICPGVPTPTFHHFVNNRIYVFVSNNICVNVSRAAVKIAKIDNDASVSYQEFHISN
jgi:hypothetical protein